MTYLDASNRPNRSLENSSYLHTTQHAPKIWISIILFPYLSWCIDGEERHDSGSYPMYVALVILGYVYEITHSFPCSNICCKFYWLCLTFWFTWRNWVNAHHLFYLSYCTSTVESFLIVRCESNHVLDLHQFSSWKFWVVLDNFNLRIFCHMISHKYFHCPSQWASTQIVSTIIIRTNFYPSKPSGWKLGMSCKSKHLGLDSH